MSASNPHPSERSQQGLDWQNFFIADVETGFGPFIVVYLAVNGWQQGQIGLVLTVGAVCGIASQLPGGAIVDGVRSKQMVIAVALAHAHVIPNCSRIRKAYSVAEVEERVLPRLWHEDRPNRPRFRATRIAAFGNHLSSSKETSNNNCAISVSEAR